MDWKTVAIDSLEMYNAKKNAINSIPCEVQLLDCDIKKTAEAIEIGLPAGSVEDIQLSRRIMQKKLEKNLATTRKVIGDIQHALSGLSDEEYCILDRLYIQKERTMESLGVELGYSKATMYRKRDAALRKYAVKLYDIAL